MGLTNFFYAPVWGVFVLLIFFYSGVVCVLLYRLLVKGEAWRSLKKLLMGFSLFLLLAVYELAVCFAFGGDGRLVSLPVCGAKLFICSTFFIFVFFQSAGFVEDRFIYCALFQLALVVVLGFIDLLYFIGISGDDSYTLCLAFVLFSCMALFIGKLFYVCSRRYDTMAQILNKESLVEAALNISALFLVSYFMMMGLLAKSGVFLGIIALLLLVASHLYLLNRWHFSRCGNSTRNNKYSSKYSTKYGSKYSTKYDNKYSSSDSSGSSSSSGIGSGSSAYNTGIGKKSYRILKWESSGEDMLMDGQPIDDYKIIQRLILHFETKKPFLDSDLKMADISKQIYTNRSYLSRALNLRLSKNFNQFVNYYRVKEACRLYLENPELKALELAKKSGFKNLSSFSTAFSLNLRYTPGEWCKEVRRRLNNNEDVSIKDYFS